MHSGTQAQSLCLPIKYQPSQINFTHVLRPTPSHPAAPPLQLSLLISIYMISVVNISGDSQTLRDNGRVEHLLTLGQPHRGRLGNSRPGLWERGGGHGGTETAAPSPTSHLHSLNGGHWQKDIM